MRLKCSDDKKINIAKQNNTTACLRSPILASSPLFELANIPRRVTEWLRLRSLSDTTQIPKGGQDTETGVEIDGETIRWCQDARTFIYGVEKVLDGCIFVEYEHRDDNTSDDGQALVYSEGLKAWLSPRLFSGATVEAARLPDAIVIGLSRKGALVDMPASLGQSVLRQRTPYALSSELQNRLVASSCVPKVDAATALGYDFSNEWFLVDALTHTSRNSQATQLSPEQRKEFP